MSFVLNSRHKTKRKTLRCRPRRRSFCRREEVEVPRTRTQSGGDEYKTQGERLLVGALVIKTILVAIKRIQFSL